MNTKLDAIILASDFSSRQQDATPLYTYGDGNILKHVVQLLQDIGLREILIVTGQRTNAFTPGLENSGCRVVCDTYSHLGFFRSVQSGVASLRSDCEGFFVLPVDFPLIRRQSLLQLMEEFTLQDVEILYPTFQDVRGYPPLVSANLKTRLLESQGAGSLEEALAVFEDKHPLLVATLPLADEGVVKSLSTKTDCQNFEKLAARRGLPSQQECAEILRLAKTPQWAAKHGQAVAALAVGIGNVMNVGRNGNSLDLEQIERAALVHDLAKGLPRHEVEGGRILLKMGFYRIANIVAAHEDIILTDRAPLSEWEVVYMANKLVNGINPVTLEEYFQDMLERYPDDQSARARLFARLENARTVQRRMESELGLSLYELAVKILAKL